MDLIKTVKPKATRIAAIDYGLKRIGIALSDETKTIAMPIETLQCEKKRMIQLKNWF